MPMQFAIGLENFLLNATVLSYTSQAPDYPAANLLNAFTWSKWQGLNAGGDNVTFDCGVAVTADYFAVAEVNWPGFDGFITVHSSTDNVNWVQRGVISARLAPSAPYYIPVPRVVACTFATDITARYWRLTTWATSGQLPSIGLAAVGKWLIPAIGDHVGVAPPKNNRNVDTYNALSDTGNFLGRSVIDKGTRLTMSLEYLDSSWVDTFGNRLIRVLEVRPVVIAYPPITNADGSVQANYLHTEGDIDPPVNTKQTCMKMVFKLRGIR